MQPNGDGQMVDPLLFFMAYSNSSQKNDPARVVYALKQEDWFGTEIVREIGPESEALSYRKMWAKARIWFDDKHFLNQILYTGLSLSFF